jgi:ankyrin repeat protein
MQNENHICPLSQEELEIANVDEFILVNVITGPDSCSYYFIHNSAQNQFFGLDKCSVTRATEEYKVLYLRDLSDGLKEQVIGLTDTTEFNLFLANEELQNDIKTGSFTFKTVATNPSTTLQEFENLLASYPLQMDAIIVPDSNQPGSNITLLHCFASVNNTGFVTALITAGANIEAKDKEEVTPLHMAAYKGYTAMAVTLINAGANINAKNNDDCTPLHIATFGKHHTIIAFLIKEGADINAKDTTNRATPMHLAAGTGNIPTVVTLIEAGAKPDTRDKNDKTPLHYIPLENHADILHRAIKNGHTATAQALIELGTNKDAKNIKGNTLLHIVVKEGLTPMAETLIGKNANINAKDNDDWTPLHWAAQEGHTETVTALIDKGANINAKDNSGKTPLLLAAKNKHTDIVRILAEKAKTLNDTSVTSSSIFQPNALQSDDNTSGQGNSNTAKANSKPLI